MHSTPLTGTSRREFLQTAATGAMAATLGSTLGTQAMAFEKPASLEVTEPWIDCHSHIWTRDTKTWPLAAGQTLDDLAPPSFTDQELLDLARPLGVGRVVLIAHTIFYVHDNGYLIHAAKKHPGRFSVVASVDFSQEDPSPLMRKLKQDYVRGFRIRPEGKPKTWLDTEPAAAMWATGAKEQMAMCCLVNADALPSIDRMCEKHPETPVVIDHFARVGVDGTIHEKDLKNLCKLARHKLTHLKISAFYALGKKEPPYLDLVPMIRRVLDAYGPERCMWGSDAPYQIVPPNTYKASVELVRDKLDFLSEGDRENLMKKTAKKVFFEGIA